MKKIEKDSKAENIARYFYQEDSNKKYLFCVLSEKSKLTMIFSHEVQDYSFLISDKMNSVFVVLENGIIGIELPVNIRYEFKAGRLIFQIHSLNLFEELVNLFFLDSTQIKAGISSKNKFEGLGIFIRSKNGEKDSFFYKIRRILNSSLIAFLIGDDEKIWGFVWGNPWKTSCFFSKIRHEFSKKMKLKIIGICGKSRLCANAGDGSFIAIESPSFASASIAAPPG